VTRCLFFTGPPARLCRLEGGHDGEHDFPTIEDMLEALRVQGDPRLHGFTEPDPDTCVVCHRQRYEHTG
jgi:hypothetical protein